MTEAIEEKIINLNKRKSILKEQLTRFEAFLISPQKVWNVRQLELSLGKIEKMFEVFDSIQRSLKSLQGQES